MGTLTLLSKREQQNSKKTFSNKIKNETRYCINCSLNNHINSSPKTDKYSH